MIIENRKAKISDALKLSILFSQVYIQTYGIEGVSDEFATEIEKQFNPSKIRSEIEGSEHDLWVSTCNDNLIAVLKISLERTCPIGSFRSAEIHKLYMLNKFFGKGIANSLLKEAEQDLWLRGEKKIWLWVLSNNSRAINFYKKENYQPIGIANLQLSENTYENLVMIKNL